MELCYDMSPRHMYPICATVGYGMALPHPLPLFLVSLPVSCPSPPLSHTLELPFQLTPRGPPNTELSSHPINFFSAPTICQTMESGSKPRRHGSCPDCKYVGITYKCAHIYPSHTCTAACEECRKGSMMGHGNTGKRSITSVGGIGAIGEKLRGNLGRLLGGGGVCVGL